ncbi:hypothetical protein CU002_2598 [Enterococcus faecium]|nr:hypothetical protein [Enterococcus faecium]
MIFCEIIFKNPTLNRRSIGKFLELCYYYEVVGGENYDRTHNHSRNY